MSLTPLFAITLILIAAPAQAVGPTGTNGISLNGLSLNGLSLNGIGPNGIGPNGISPNGASMATGTFQIDGIVLPATAR